MEVTETMTLIVITVAEMESFGMYQPHIIPVIKAVIVEEFYKIDIACS